MDDSEKGTPVATDASSQQKEGDLSQQLGSQPTAHDATGRKHRRKRGGRKHRSASAKPEESISMDQQDEGGIGTERQDEGGMRSPQDPEARPAKRFSPGNFRGQTSAGEEGVVHPVPSARTRDKRVGMPAEGSGSAPLRGDKPAEGRGNAPPRGETPVSPTSAKVLGAANHWRGQSEASGQRWAGQRRQHERPVRAARADEETDAPAARSAGQIGESGKQGSKEPPPPTPLSSPLLASQPLLPFPLPHLYRGSAGRKSELPPPTILTHFVHSLPCGDMLYCLCPLPIVLFRVCFPYLPHLWWGGTGACTRLRLLPRWLE